MIRLIPLVLPLGFLIACGGDEPAPTSVPATETTPALVLAPGINPEEGQQAIFDAIAAAQQGALLPAPGPDGYLTADEEVAVMAYFDALASQDTALNEAMQELTKLTPEQVEEITSAMEHILSQTPPAIANQQVNDAIALYHECTVTITQAFLDLVTALPEDLEAEENQSEVMRLMVGFEQTMQQVMPDMITANTQMNQIAGADLMEAALAEPVSGE